MGTCLRSISRVDFNHLFTGPFCLVSKKVKKLSPRYIANASINTVEVVLFHIVDRKIFNGDSIKFIDYFTRLLMRKIASFPSGSLMNAGNHLAGFSF